MMTSFRTGKRVMELVKIETEKVVDYLSKKWNASILK